MGCGNDGGNKSGIQLPISVFEAHVKGPRVCVGFMDL